MRLQSPTKESSWQSVILTAESHLFCQAGKEMETGGEPRPRVIYRWAQFHTLMQSEDSLSFFIEHGSGLVSGTVWSSQSHTGAQCLTTQVPLTHVTSITIYILTHNHYCYLWRCIGSKSQDRNKVANIKFHSLAFGIHCLFLLGVTRLMFFFFLHRLVITGR